MIDRLVHHAEVLALKGDSYRLKDRDLGRVPHHDQHRRMNNKRLPWVPAHGRWVAHASSVAPENGAVVRTAPLRRVAL